MLVVAVLVDLAYWTVWFLHRDWVASSTSASYVAFEQAFVAADTGLGVACLLAWWALQRQAPSALLWLLTAGGAGLYLLALDVLYDIQHGIYAAGSGGLVELGVNALTAAFSLTALRWAWSRRDALMKGPNRSEGLR